MMSLVPSNGSDLFSGDTLQKHAEKYEHAVARSKLPFSEYDVERIKDRKDQFAAKIFQTSLWENRTRLSLEDFRLSRSYFFGVFIREPKNSDGSLRMYPFYLLTSKVKCVPNNVILLVTMHTSVTPRTKQSTITMRETSSKAWEELFCSLLTKK